MTPVRTTVARCPDRRAMIPVWARVTLALSVIVLFTSIRRTQRGMLSESFQVPSSLRPTSRSPSSEALFRLRGGMASDALTRESANSFLEPAVLPHVKELQAIQDEHATIMRKHIADRRALEAQLFEARSKLFSRRKESIQKIPGFWSKVLSTGQETRKMLCMHDMDVLEYLDDIEAELLPSPQHGFTLHFRFRAGNPHFKHPVLSKTYKMVQLIDGIELAEIQCNPNTITWTTKDPTKKEITRKVHGVTQRVIVSVNSFFHWYFNSGKYADDDLQKAATSDLASKADLASKTEELHETLRAQKAHWDVNIGMDIRTNIIPNAADIYTGAAPEDPQANLYLGPMDAYVDEDGKIGGIDTTKSKRELNLISKQEIAQMRGRGGNNDVFRK